MDMSVKFTGTVKMYNGQYGFITSLTGDIFFHNSKVQVKSNIEVGDEVEFQVEPSNKKRMVYRQLISV